jgi:hypothetical protein
VTVYDGARQQTVCAGLHLREHINPMPASSSTARMAECCANILLDAARRLSADLARIEFPTDMN